MSRFLRRVAMWLKWHYVLVAGPTVKLPDLTLPGWLWRWADEYVERTR